MNEEVRKWLIKCLSDWRETFRDELENEEGIDENRKGWDELTRHINNLEQDKPIDCEGVFFHLWQHLAQNEVEE